MMRTRQTHGLTNWTIITFLACCAFACSETCAFGPYEHMVAAPANLKNQANLADYWGQSFAIHWDNIPPYADIVPLFPWTHGCLRNGRVGVVPRTPTNYGQSADGKTAEDDMLLLISRMTPAHQSAPLLIETALGFRTHNRLDSCAHFTFFWGGSVENWIQHKFGEQYAQFLIYEVETGIPLEGTVGTIEVPVHSAGHAGIILLAQKAFRKARHSIDTLDKTLVPEEERQPGPVGTLNDISAAITWSNPREFSAGGKTIARQEALTSMGGEPAFSQWEASLKAAWPGCKAGAQ